MTLEERYWKVRYYIEREWKITRDFIDVIEYAGEIYECSGFKIPVEFILEVLYKLSPDDFKEEADTIAFIFGLSTEEVEEFIERMGGAGE